MRLDHHFKIPLNADLLVVSDIHIRRPFDERFNLLLQLIESAKSAQLKTLVLNGDIFDFFFGCGNYFQNLYKPLFAQLEELATTTGCRVLFIEGNHEFSLDKISREKIEIHDSFGTTISIENSKIKIIHGDLMHYDWKYFTFRRVVRSKIVEVIASIVPQILLDKFTLWFATTSRKKDVYRSLNHQKILATAKNQLETSKADHLIFGHFHHPYDETLADGKKILSVNSWDKPSGLVYSDGQFIRI